MVVTGHSSPDLVDCLSAHLFPTTTMSTQEKSHTSISDLKDSATDEMSYPRRNLNDLHCPVVTFRCAKGALSRISFGYVPPSAGQGAPVPCVPCAYKVCNFDTALDLEFTKRIPNQRPERCPRTPSNTCLMPRIVSSGKARPDEREVGETTGYRRGMNVLAVGDGDMTFSLFLANVVVRGTESNGKNMKRPGGLVVATSYEDSHTLRKVYPNFDKTLNLLNSFGKRVIIGYKVDATRLGSTLPKEIQAQRRTFHRICWNFPCSAVESGQDGQNDDMEKNKELVKKFVANALPYLDEEGGEIHMAHKTKPPFNQWGLEKVALEGIECNGGIGRNVRRRLEFKGRIVFDKCMYQGYTPRKALDRKSFPCHDACVYVFGWTSSNSTLDGCSSSTIPRKVTEGSNSLVIPVTESVIEMVRSCHLQNAERRECKQRNKRHATKTWNNGKRNKRRKGFLSANRSS